MTVMTERIAETLVAELPPIRVDEGGAVRVGNTRVTLETVIGAYNDGATVDEIVLAYDVLRPADVHAVISYYLRHQPEVDQYLAEREVQAEEVCRRIDAQPFTQELRRRIRARQQRAAS